MYKLMSDTNIDFRVAQFIDIDPLMELVQEFYRFDKIIFDERVIKAFTALLSANVMGMTLLLLPLH